MRREVLVRIVTATVAIALALAIFVNDASAQRFRFRGGGVRAVDNAAEVTTRVRPRPTYPRVVSRTGVERRLTQRLESWEPTLSAQAQRRRNVTSTESRIEDSDEFISLADLIEWSLELGLSFVEWESADRTATEVAANRLARSPEYWPSFCSTIGGSRYYMVPSDETVCLNGSSPLIASAPLDLSSIRVRPRQPSAQVDTRRARFDFNDQIGRDPIWEAYFFNFRTEFPAVWGAFVDQINAGVRRGDDMAAVFDASRTFMAAFVESQSVYVPYAEAGPLVAMIDAEAALVEALAETNVAACAEYSMTGTFESETAAALTEEQQAAFARMSSTMIDAMVSGRRSPVSRETIDPSRWDLIWRKVSHRGIPDADIEALTAGNPASLPPERACRFGLAYSQALRDLPIEQRADYIADLFRVE